MVVDRRIALRTEDYESKGFLLSLIHNLKWCPYLDSNQKAIMRTILSRLRLAISTYGQKINFSKININYCFVDIYIISHFH